MPSHLRPSRYVLLLVYQVFAIAFWSDCNGRMNDGAQGAIIEVKTVFERRRAPTFCPELFSNRIFLFGQESESKLQIGIAFVLKVQG